MTPDAIQQWQGILRDLVIVSVAAFMLIFETVAAAEPNPYLIGAGLTLLGIPPALRLDRVRRRLENASDDASDKSSG